MDSPGLPFGLLLIAMVGIPVCLAVLIGTRAFHSMVPLVFRCRRCDRDFLRKAHRRFPTACPRCHARNWNA
jgi:Zn finger protein HypA/HybF involved in hydrogenase expression